MDVLSSPEAHEAFVRKNYQYRFLPVVLMVWFIDLGFELIKEGVFKGPLTPPLLWKICLKSGLWALMFSSIYLLITKGNIFRDHAYGCPQTFEGYHAYTPATYGKLDFAKSGFVFLGDQKLLFVKQKKKEMVIGLELDHVQACDFKVVVEKKRWLTRFILGNTPVIVHINEGEKVHRFCVEDPEKMKTVLFKNSSI